MTNYYKFENQTSWHCYQNSNAACSRTTCVIESYNFKVKGKRLVMIYFSRDSSNENIYTYKTSTVTGYGTF